MFPGDAPTSPLPLTYRIAIALGSAAYRTCRRRSGRGVCLWQNRLDDLIDRYPRGQL